MLSQSIINIFQLHIEALGFTPLIHFELEGCCRFPDDQAEAKINFPHVNTLLKQQGIEGTLVPEYWQNQWEYVSDFSGQSPLKEAHNLALVLQNLPYWFALQGVEKTHISPVVWSGDKGKLAFGSKDIFIDEDVRSVHIPNAIQINVSALDVQGCNIMCQEHFGEYLQQCFLDTSLACCLLYMPESDAFERLALKDKYGLADELCSPTDISGGHQGSIALYKEYGKHNQAMGVEALIVDQFEQALISEQNWQKTARIEHRLGASSVDYDPYVNVIYALGNLIDALEVFVKGQCLQGLRQVIKSQPLPVTLANDEQGFDAITLFKNSQWLTQRVNQSAQAMLAAGKLDSTKWANCDLGEQLKHSVLERYIQIKKIVEKA